MILRDTNIQSIRASFKICDTNHMFFHCIEEFPAAHLKFALTVSADS